MASLVSEVSVGQITELLGRLDRAGFDPRTIKKILGNKQAARAMLLGLQKLQEFRLIHDLYNPTEVVHEIVAERLLKYRYDIARFDSHDFASPPSFTEDPEIGVVLAVTLNTLKETLEFWCSWALERHSRSFLWKGMLSKTMILGGTKFVPNTIQWVRINRSANYERSPDSVREKGVSLPGWEVLALLAQHPEVVRHMDGSAEHPYLLMGGLDYRTVAHERFPDTPYADYYEDEGISVSFQHSHEPRKRYAVPEFINNR